MYLCVSNILTSYNKNMRMKNDVMKKKLEILCTPKKSINMLERLYEYYILGIARSF